MLVKAQINRRPHPGRALLSVMILKPKVTVKKIVEKV